MYAARFPDGLDLLARWAPITQAAALTAVTRDLLQLATGHRGHRSRPAA